jgi:hypothetical protein
MASEPKQTALPWWVTLISVIVTAMVCVMGTVYALGGGAPKTPGAPAGVASLVSDTITYIPHIMLLFGVLADMFTYEGVYSIPSLVGILSIVFNWIFRYFWKGLFTIFEKTKLIATAEGPTPAERTVTPSAFVPAAKQATTAEARKRLGQAGGAEVGLGTIGKRFFQDYDGCNVQGFGSLASEFAPQTLVVTSTVFMYYLFDNVSNRGWLNSLVGLLFFGAVYIGQTYVIGQCPPPAGGKQFTTVQNSLMALVEGTIMGGLSYATVAAYYPTRLPSSVISPFPRKSRDDLMVGPDGRYVDEDGSPYIILANGQAYPDLASQEDRDLWAKIIGRTLGTGDPPKPGTCTTTV